MTRPVVRSDLRATGLTREHAAMLGLLAVVLLCVPVASYADPLDDFHRAVRLNDLAAVRLHLKSNALINAPDADGRTALIQAIRYGSLDLALMLLKSGASVDAPDRDGWTALHFAAESGDSEAVRILIDHGAESNRVDPYRYTPLHLAAREGHHDVCDLLIAAGADPAARIDVDLTAADLADRFPDLQDHLNALARR